MSGKLKFSNTMLYNQIEEFLIKKGFKKNNDFSKNNIFTYDLIFSKLDLFRVSVFFDKDFISVDIDSISMSDKYVIARRYEVDRIEEFIFLVEKTSRSPLFQER